jgi:RNAse P Rpr2/Rpp21/SNM1 subunit domain
MSASNRAADFRTIFLQDAAKLMATISPSTASYLASESIQLDLAQAQPKKPFEDHQRQTFCTACGNVFIPGWSCSIARGDKRRSSAPITQKTVQRATIVYNCHACHYQTTLSTSSVNRPEKKVHEEHVSRSTNVAVEGGRQISCEPTTVTTKTSSKKRAKARKDKAGLHSLLKSNKDRTASPQLSLMDLMMP